MFDNTLRKLETQVKHDLTDLGGWVDLAVFVNRSDYQPSLLTKEDAFSGMKNWWKLPEERRLETVLMPLLRLEVVDTLVARHWLFNLDASPSDTGPYDRKSGAPLHVRHIPSNTEMRWIPQSLARPSEWLGDELVSRECRSVPGFYIAEEQTSFDDLVKYTDRSLYSGRKIYATRNGAVTQFEAVIQCAAKMGLSIPYSAELEAALFGLHRNASFASVALRDGSYEGPFGLIVKQNSREFCADTISTPNRNYHLASKHVILENSFGNYPPQSDSTQEDIRATHLPFFSSTTEQSRLCMRFEDGVPNYALTTLVVDELEDSDPTMLDKALTMLAKIQQFSDSIVFKYIS